MSLAKKQDCDVVIQLPPAVSSRHGSLQRWSTTTAKSSRNAGIIVIIFEVASVSQGKSFFLFKVATHRHRAFTA
jgi:hypothetical protein